MTKPVVIIGMGEMGELFGQGFLKVGIPVVPVLRGMDLDAQAETLPEPAGVIVAVGESELDSVLPSMPQVWRQRLVLLQNELLPGSWERHGLVEPTVVVVWFDKKKGRPFVNVLPTPVSGPRSRLIVKALARVGVPCHEAASEELLYELVRKNLYILTINIAGLRLPAGATVDQLWAENRPLAEGVAWEVLDIQEALTRTQLPREKLMKGMLEGFRGDPDHICMGRTAHQRLSRVLYSAGLFGIETPVLREIAAESAPDMA